MALATLAKVKALLGVTSSSQDVQLDALRLAADQAIKTDCDRAFESATYTEYYSGTGTRYLCLRETPVASITTIHLDYSGYYNQNPEPVFGSDKLLTAGKDYALKIDRDGMSFSGIVERINTVWAELNRAYVTGHVTTEVSPALGNIKVVYTAGYTTIPEDLQWALALIVRRMQQYAKIGWQLGMEKLRDYTYQLTAAKHAISELGDVQRTLRMYKKVPY